MIEIHDVNLIQLYSHFNMLFNAGFLVSDYADWRTAPLIDIFIVIIKCPAIKKSAIARWGNKQAIVI